MFTWAREFFQKSPWWDGYPNTWIKKHKTLTKTCSITQKQTGNDPKTSQTLKTNPFWFISKYWVLKYIRLINWRRVKWTWTDPNLDPKTGFFEQAVEKTKISKQENEAANKRIKTMFSDFWGKNDQITEGKNEQTQKILSIAWELDQRNL